MTADYLTCPFDEMTFTAIEKFRRHLADAHPGMTMRDVKRATDRSRERRAAHVREQYARDRRLEQRRRRLEEDARGKGHQTP